MSKIINTFLKKTYDENNITVLILVSPRHQHNKEDSTTFSFKKKKKKKKGSYNCLMERIKTNYFAQ